MSTLTSGAEDDKINTACKSVDALSPGSIKENADTVNKHNFWTSPVIEIKDSCSFEALTTRKYNFKKSEDNLHGKKSAEPSSHTSNIFNIFNDRSKWSKESNQKRLSGSGGQSSTMILSRQTQWNDNQNQKIESLANAVDISPSSPDSKKNFCTSARKSINPAKIARQQAEEIFRLQQKLAMQDNIKVTSINGTIDSHDTTKVNSLDVVELSDSETETDNLDKCKMDSKTINQITDSDNPCDSSKSLTNCLSKPLTDEDKGKNLETPLINTVNEVEVQEKTENDLGDQIAIKSQNDNIRNQNDENHQENSKENINSDQSCPETTPKDNANNCSNSAAAEIEASLLDDDEEDNKGVGDDNQEINDDLLNDDEILNDEPSGDSKMEIELTSKNVVCQSLENSESKNEQTSQAAEFEIDDTVNLIKPGEEPEAFSAEAKELKTVEKLEVPETGISETLITETQESKTVEKLELPETGISETHLTKESPLLDSSKLIKSSFDELGTKTKEVDLTLTTSEIVSSLPKISSPKKRPLSPNESNEDNLIDNKKLRLENCSDSELSPTDHTSLETSVVNHESADAKVISVDSSESLRNCEASSDLKCDSENMEEISEIKDNDVDMEDTQEKEAPLQILTIDSEQEMECKINNDKNVTTPIESGVLKNPASFALKIANITSEETSELLIDSDEEVKICDNDDKNIKSEEIKKEEKLECSKLTEETSPENAIKPVDSINVDKLEAVEKNEKVETEEIKMEDTQVELKNENHETNESSISATELTNETETKPEVNIDENPQTFSAIDILDDDADVKICSPKTERSLTKKNLTNKIKSQSNKYFEDSHANQTKAYKKRIEDLERIIVTWRTTAQELQRQVIELSVRQQRLEKRRPILNKVQYRNVGIQVTHTRILNNPQQPSGVLPGSQGATVTSNVPPRLAALSTNQGSNQVVPVNNQTTQLSSLLSAPPASSQPMLMASTPGQNNRPIVPGPTNKPIVYQIVSSAPSRFVTTAPVQAMPTSILPATGTTPALSVPLVTTSNPSNQYVMVNMANTPTTSAPTNAVSAGQPITMVTNMPGNQSVVPQQIVSTIASRSPSNNIISQVTPNTTDNSQKQVIDLTNDEDERPSTSNQRTPVVVTGRAPQVVAQAPTSTGMVRAGPPPLIPNQQQVRVVGPPVPPSNVRPGQPTAIFVRAPPMIAQRPTYLVTQNVQPRPIAPIGQPGVRVSSPSTSAQYRPPVLASQPIQQNRALLGAPKPPPLIPQLGSSQQIRVQQPPAPSQNTSFSGSPMTGSAPNLKRLPPKPSLKISRVDSGIVLSWNMNLSPSYAKIASYQLYAYQEGNTPPNTALWKKVGDVKALPLPMACTLTQFVEGHKYHFAVRAVDVHGRLGPLSDACSIHLTSTH